MAYEVETFLQQAATFYRAGDLENAENVLLDALKNFPKVFSIYNSLGLIAYRKEQYAQAESYYLKALDLEKGSVSVMYNLALSYYQQQKFQDAVAALLVIVEVSEEFAQAYLLLGKIGLRNQEIEEADRYFSLLAQKFPGNMDYLQNIIVSLLESQEYILAKKYCLQAIEFDPAQCQILYNLGVIAEKQRRIDEAISYYQQALAVQPDYFPAINNLGVLYLAKGEPITAKSCFEKAHALQPDNEAVQYTLSALSGYQDKEGAPAHFISQLFDHYAENFDQHLLEGLDYSVPGLLYDACKRFLKPSGLFVLDLGCGTGLIAAMFLKHASWLVGVDLSEGMLAQAKKKEIYSKLYCQEILLYLKTNQEKFDVVLAGDVFVYMGRLEQIFAYVAKTLAPNGLFGFSVELSLRENFLLQPSGRFAHSSEYIRALLDENQFELLIEKPAVTRSQFNQPVQGMIYVARQKV